MTKAGVIIFTTHTQTQAQKPTNSHIIFTAHKISSTKTPLTHTHTHAAQTYYDRAELCFTDYFNYLYT